MSISYAVFCLKKKPQQSCLERIRSLATLHSVGGEGREVALKVYVVSLSLYSLSSVYSTFCLSSYGLLRYFLSFPTRRSSDLGFVRRRHCTVLGGKVGRWL